LAALDLLEALALRVLQPFLAAADLFALDGPRFAVFLVDLRDVFLFLEAAAFFPAVERLAAFLLRVAAAFFPARDLLAALRFLVAAAFLAPAERDAFVPPLRTGFRADFLLVVVRFATLFTFLDFFGGFTKTSVPSLIE
jgi:hypothetical protein